MFCGRFNPNKYFQKPNILRKKPKDSRKSTVLQNGSNTKPSDAALALKKGSNLKGNPTSAPFTATSGNTPRTSGALNSLISSRNPFNNNNDSQNYINVEIFLNKSDNAKIEDNTGNLRDWNNEDTQAMDEESTESDSDDDYPTMKMVPMRSTSNDTDNSDVEEMVDDVPAQQLTIDYITSSTKRFKCDYPNCTRRFKSGERLKKHRQRHKSDPYKGILKRVECPAKKEINGERKPCGKLFISKDSLTEHLTVDHSLDDAAYKCESCSRLFFWEVAMRAHVRAGCGRARLVCGWAGCGAAFQHACRLREHARSHTGDKPYPCRFPNCGWSFRTASKLLRHARRHTGERRHACRVCARAFPRPEHLRDHVARHHRHPLTCPHIGCHRKFISVRSLVTHVQRKHNRELSQAAIDKYTVLISLPLDPCAPLEQIGTTPQDEIDSTQYQYQTTEAYELDDAEDKVTVEIQEDAVPITEEEEVAEAVAEIEDVEYSGRSARTHCTWPLLTRLSQQDQADTLPQHQDLEQMLDGDVQVELLEGGESNIYTVRSDLFLHGNVLNNEDSVQMASVVMAETGAEDDAEEDNGLDTGLAIMDTHPASHIMQEELMYTDAVDESAFRVFLQSGEEVQIV